MTAMQFPQLTVSGHTPEKLTKGDFLKIFCVLQAENPLLKQRNIYGQMLEQFLMDVDPAWCLKTLQPYYKLDICSIDLAKVSPLL